MSREDPKRADIDISAAVFSGDDKNIDWLVTTGALIKVAANATLAAVTLSVEPLEEEIANAAKLRFGNLVVTLSAAAKVGQTSLSISALDGYLWQGQEGRKVQDVTGFTMEMTVTLPPQTTVLLTETVSIQTAASGHVRAALSDDDTETTLTAKSYRYRLRRTDAGFESTLAWGDLVLRRL